MEMHQVRYFLAVARTLNFTRAAEECNVAQPSLTRAIRQLEGELGGDLFRRERPQASACCRCLSNVMRAPSAPALWPPRLRRGRSVRLDWRYRALSIPR